MLCLYMLVLNMYMLCFDLVLVLLPLLTVPHSPASCMLSSGESPEAEDVVGAYLAELFLSR